MTSRWHGDVTACDQECSAVTDSLQPNCTFYDDSLRPKSFLHDEVDEFNRVLAELLQSRQRPEPTAEEDDLMCGSSWSQDSEVDAFQMRQLDRRWKNVATADIRQDTATESQPSVTQRTSPCDEDADGEEDADAGDDNDDEVLKIVEEEDYRLVAKDDNIHSSHIVFTDDLFNEVSELNLVLLPFLWNYKVLLYCRASSSVCRRHRLQCDVSVL